MSERGHRKERIGTVISDKMQKTVVVRVDSFAKHPVYKKIIHISKKYKVHDEEKKAKVGDKVRIAETRPISKDKNWRLIEVIK